MRLHFRLVSLILVALLVPALTACDRGVKIGSLQVIKPKPPLTASSLQVVRHHALGATPAKADQVQKLEVNLTSGRATFTDSDKKVVPAQLTAEQIEQLRNAIANREWQVGHRSPSKNVKDATFYVLTVYTGSKAITPQASWAEPAQKELPPAIKQIEEIFDQVSRLAHPLSENVDLLK